MVPDRAISVALEHERVDGSGVVEAPGLLPGAAWTGSGSGCLRPLRELSEQLETRALVVFGSRGRGDAQEASDLDLLLIRRGALDPAVRQAVWKQARQIIGPLPVDLDLLVEDEHSAQEMAGSRWHVLGRIAQERVIYAS